MQKRNYETCGAAPPMTVRSHASHETAVTLTGGEHHATLNGIVHWYRVTDTACQTTPLVIVPGGPGRNIGSLQHHESRTFRSST